jgi:DNA polymerase III epsilon subunit-like protein
MLLGVTDTETTGIVRDFRSPDAPYLASITAIIYDTEAQRVQASFNTMIQPVEWDMPPEAGAINGLETEVLAAYGLPIEIVLPVVMELFRPVDVIVGHNIAFDVKMLASGLYRCNMLDDLDSILGKEVYCTMRESKDIVQAKNIRGHLKLPKLVEAYEYFFDRPLDNSHSANADAVAALELYLAIKQHQAENAGSEISL